VTQHFYRFRPIKALLDDYHELENQEIYFASPSELNDPQEGVCDVFWLGDRVVWKNLHRHYLKCLTRAMQVWCATAGEHELDWRIVPMVDPWLPENASPELNEIVEQIEAEFFSPEIEAYIDALAARRTPVRRDELRFYIESLNLLAVSKIVSCHERSGRPLIDPIEISTPKFIDVINVAVKLCVKVISQAESAGTTVESRQAVSALFQTVGQNRSQNMLMYQSDGLIDLSVPGKKFVFVDFPRSYVDKLDSILYPPWYAACFMSDCEHAALWAHYGGNHTGACLIFKSADDNGSPSISLIHATSVDMSGPREVRCSHPFIPVTYSNDGVDVDFFRSLGRLPNPLLKKTWFFDSKDGWSTCARDMREDNDAWRARYWMGFERGATTKTRDWQPEGERRLLLHSLIIDFSSVGMRKVKYDFASLVGIIFGVKTSEDDKIRIMRIIDAKCDLSGRNDFKFYQATYSSVTGRLAHSEMALLNSRARGKA